MILLADKARLIVLSEPLCIPRTRTANHLCLYALYVWTQDSLMLGSMVHGAETQEEEVLKMLVLNDLAKIHGIKLETLRDELFERMHVFDWNRNINSMGAFGVFGPNQFRDVYQSLTRPAANGRLHFAGETISTTHGWVAGALESADRVFEQLWCSHDVWTHSTKNGVLAQVCFVRHLPSK
ncbi:hypothetical protein RSAG8_13387, partial [Rhizoctonia solani AG-8 WAC10335]